MSIYKIFKLCKCVRVFVLSLPSNVACGKNTALSLNEGILSGEESGDEVGVLFLCGDGGEGGGEPDAPVSLCTAVAIDCAIGMGWDFVVCDVVGLSVLEVSVGTDMGCFCLRLCISQSDIQSWTTGQVSLCTSDGGATVCQIVSHLILLVTTHKTDYL